MHVITFISLSFDRTVMFLCNGAACDSEAAVRMRSHSRLLHTNITVSLCHLI